MKKLLIALTILLTTSFVVNADVLVLRQSDQCPNLKIALDDADATLEGVKTLTDVNIKKAVKYSLTQNKAGNSLTAGYINAPWINTDMSYNQLLDAAKTCEMPLPYESPTQKKARSKRVDMQIRCSDINQLYHLAVDGAIHAGLGELSWNSKAATQILDRSTKSLCESKFNPRGRGWHPDGEYTFSKLRAAYGKCVQEGWI
jgi:hypothetical protein